MKEFFIELFDYNHFHNQQLLMAFLANKEKTSEKSEKLLNHILFAQHTWNSRVLEEKTQYGIWELRPLQELRRIDDENHGNTNSILQNFDLDTSISYTNSKNEKYSNSIRDILFHIINHSTYHRGQIASDFRRNQIDPLVSDYIFYKRE